MMKVLTGGEVMSDHDPLCQDKDRWNAGLSVGDVSGDCPGCSFIAKVRADEREDADHRVDRQILRNARRWRDLRAKVEALPTYVREPDEREYVILSDVLALFGGSDG